MTQKPTYKELEQRVKGLEEETIKRKQAEESLRQRESILKSIFRAAPTGIGMVYNRVITQANERLCQILGYSEEELLGQSARIVYPTEEDFEFVGREKYIQISERGTGSVETRFQRKNGEIIDVLLSSTPLDSEDLSSGVTFTALDITDRRNAEEALRKAHDELEKRVKTRTAELVTANEKLSREIRERKRTEERLDKINNCFLNFVPDPLENINRLTALCGELLHGTFALYNRLHKGMLCSWGQWNTPPDYNPIDKPEGHICYDLIKRKSYEFLHVRNLRGTHYAQIDSNVTRYKLRTYVGRKVKFADEYAGSLCVVYQDDFIPSREDRGLLDIIASAIGMEEERKRAEEEREKLIDELQKALKEIKTLRGTLPLCSYCNKIRDDKGNWEKVDVYIHKHSQADISHSICPECAKEHYPDFDIYDD